MGDAKDLKTAIERNIKALTLRPSMGRGTAITTVTLRDGVTADIEDGGWKLVADESTGDGGAGLGPDPGVFTRAGLGSCLAIGYAMWAAKLGVPLDSVEVTVETDYDAAGMYGIDRSVSPGWGAVRFAAKISSPAPEEDVRKLIDFADRHSSVLDIIRRAVPVTGEHLISAPAKR